MVSGNREDYLINILRLTEGKKSTKTTELSTYMGISPASVTEMLKILSNEGFVEYAKYRGFSLTEKGTNYARQIRKKHNVMERFLIDILNIDEQTAHEEACKMEHAISAESIVKLCHMVGNTIDCDCQSCVVPCKACYSNGVAVTLPLMDVNIGDKGTISHLKSNDSDIVNKLISMGFIPEKEIIIESKSDDTFTILVEDLTLVINSKFAGCIYVDIV